MLSVKSLNAGYENKKIIEDLFLDIKKGEIVSIIGPNGSGKSTLLSCLTRYIKPISGEIFLENESIYNKSIKEFSKKVAILSQHHSVTSNVTVRQLVSYGRLPHKRWYERQNKEDYEIVEKAMKYTNVLKYENNFVNSLSGGEQQRVWIAMALAQTPDVLLLDEPTTYLDISHQLELMKLIHTINKEKKITIIMVLHDLNQASEYSDKIVLMKSGKIFDYGLPRDVINCENLKNVYNIKCHICENNKKLMITPIDICK
ncbi:MAG: ABC transporter ATP-binding protein [Clostridiales bacterium]|nr:ABC transporter ATP-binding protein [Clostridiales bacterium]